MDADSKGVSRAGSSFNLRDWTVEPALNRIERAATSVRLEPKHMDVLVFLAEHPGEIQSKDQIFEAVWPRQYVAESALTRAIAELRKALDDDARNPRYIETIPKRGYRLIASVGAPSVTPPASHRHGDLGWALFGVAALGLLMLLAIWQITSRIQGSKNPLPEPPFRVSQQTTSPAFDLYPSFSPDGSSLVYSSDRSGDFELYILQIASGGDEIALTDDDQNNIQAAWSPDGNWIAYHSIGRGGIWMVPSLGGQPRQLAEFGSAPSWSPDGSLIAFESQGPWLLNEAAASVPLPGVIWLVDPTGAELRQVTETNRPWGGHATPLFSPDGKRIFFSNRLDLWSVDVEDGRLQSYRQPAKVIDPIVTTDGKTVYFLSSILNDRWLCRMRIDVDEDDLEIEPLLNMEARHLALSPNGKRLALSRFESSSNLWAVQLDSSSSLPTDEPRALTHETNDRNTLPAFSPDGDSIAFNRFSTGTSASIWLIRTDGSHTMELISKPGVDFRFPQWTDDGESLFLLSEGLIRRLDIETRRLEDFAPVRLEWRQWALSPDATRFVTVRQTDSIENLWMVNVDGSDEKQITFDPEYASWPNWSPDGRWIAFEIARGGHTYLAIVPSEGGEVRQLTFEPEHSWPFGWSPDGSKITFAGSRNGVWNVYWVSLEDGSIQQLTRHEGNRGSFVRFPAWSPKGNQIVYELSDTTADTWFVDLAP